MKRNVDEMMEMINNYKYTKLIMTDLYDFYKKLDYDFSVYEGDEELFGLHGGGLGGEHLNVSQRSVTRLCKPSGNID